MFVNEEGQLHLARNTKGQWGRKEEDGYRAESEIDSCVQEDRLITEERESRVYFYYFIKVNVQ